MWWLMILGVIVLLVNGYDVVWTILSASEAGPLSWLIMYFYKHITRRFPPNVQLSHNFIRYIGLFTFLTSILIWYISFWLGWALIFVAFDSSVVASSGVSPHTGVVEKVYFIGYMIFTAGLGDYKPVGGVFQILSVVANATGIILVTITITYLLSATDAAMKQRQMAGHVSALGDGPVSILLNAWNGKDIKSLERPFSTIANNVTICAQQLVRFPLIFNFHSLEEDYASSIRLATLDETITIIENAFPPEMQIDRLLQTQCRRTVDQFLSAVERAVGLHKRNVKEPPVPSLQALEKAGIGMLLHRDWRLNMQRKAVVERRRLLHKLVVDSGREWDAVYGWKCRWQ